MKHQLRSSRLKRLALVALLSSLGAGCNTLAPVSPPLSSNGFSSSPTGLTQRPASNSAPADVVAAAARPPMVVRGQSEGGYAIPPLGDIAPDGGRHNREPMPVNGQPPANSKPQERVAQGPPATNEVRELPAPGTSQPLPSTLATPAPLADPAIPSPYTSQQPPASLQYPDPSSIDGMPTISDEGLLGGRNIGEPFPYTPVTRTADIIVNGYPARTGRIMFGGAVNSDAGLTGQITVEERNFDITRFPSSFQDLVSGTAFRGAGQTFRLEAVPGSRFKRYTVNFTEPYLFNYPVSLSVSGFLFDRRYEDWDEERLGGRFSLGYRITPDLSISGGLRGERVKVSDPSTNTVQQLNDVLGSNSIYSWQTQLIHDTRNSPFAPSEGHYFEASYEQAFGDFDFGRTEFSFNRYFLVRQRADRSGRQTLTVGVNTGFSGENTPIFENFFAGGYSTLRGFEFRGASPVIDGVQVGGRFKFLGTVEYMFPITADDMLRGVMFVDYGTVEREIEMNRENFRVAPGFGIRIAVPALGPAPLAFDLAFPVSDAAGDQQQTFNFFMGYSRRL